MLTVFVSGNDTDVGKTHVMGLFAGTLALRGLSVQIVKLVETGMPADDSIGDADRALSLAQKIYRRAMIHGRLRSQERKSTACALEGSDPSGSTPERVQAEDCSSEQSPMDCEPGACVPEGSKIDRNITHEGAQFEYRAPATPRHCVSEENIPSASDTPPISLVSAFRLVRYSKPLAPTRAAQLDGEKFSIETLKAKLSELPSCDVRLVEGAGGLAVPIDERGCDWADFAREAADKTLLVVENRLGAICQARFLSMYCKGKDVPSPFFWLNQIKEQSEDVLASNHLEIPKIGMPILGESSPGEGTFSISGVENILG